MASKSPHKPVQSYPRNDLAASRGAAMCILPNGHVHSPNTPCLGGGFLLNTRPQPPFPERWMSSSSRTSLPIKYESPAHHLYVPATPDYSPLFSDILEVKAFIWNPQIPSACLSTSYSPIFSYQHISGAAPVSATLKASLSPSRSDLTY